MTTIAVNRTCMASDSLLVESGRRHYGQKLFRVKGDIIGIAGDWPMAIRFIKWYRGTRKTLPDFGFMIDSEMVFRAVVLTKDNQIICWDEFLEPVSIADDFWAIGSGADAALAAMHLGLAPEQAIEIAAKVDSSTGLPVCVERL